MKSLLFCTLLVIALAGAGCDSGSDLDTFETVIFDTDGRLILEGTLRLYFQENNTDGPQPIAGTWRFAERNGHDSPLPSSGRVSGGYLGSDVNLNLDEPAPDSGTGLHGVYDGDRIVGEVYTVTIAGPILTGTFEAVRD